MKFTHDTVAQAAYLRLSESNSIRIDKTVLISDSVLVDVDSNSQIIGVEFLHASEQEQLIEKFKDLLSADNSIKLDQLVRQVG